MSTPADLATVPPDASASRQHSIPAASTTKHGPIQEPYELGNFDRYFTEAVNLIDPGPFFVCSSHVYAPNPLLHVTSIGDLGVPLPKELLKDSEGIRTIKAPDLQVRGTCWKTWVEREAPILASMLAFGAPSVKVVLEAAVIVPPGSKVEIPDQDIPPRCFGKLAVILPSLEGCEFEVTNPFAEEKKSIPREDTAEGKVAHALWLVGAKPIVQSGETSCVTVLLYSLITARAAPQLPRPLAGFNRIVELLQWRYSDDNSRVGKEEEIAIAYHLPGKRGPGEEIPVLQERLLEIMANAGKKAGMRVLLATLNIVQTGNADGWKDPENYRDDYYGYGRRRGYWDEDESDDLPSEAGSADHDEDGHYVFDEGGGDGYTETIDGWQDFFSNAKASGGTWNCSTEEDLIMPYIESTGDLGAPDTDNLDRDCGSLTKMWKRAAIVMWPRERDVQVFRGLFAQDACHFLDHQFWLEPGDDVRRKDLADGIIGVNVKQGSVSEATRRAYLRYATSTANPNLARKIVTNWGPPGDIERLKGLVEFFQDDWETIQTMAQRYLDQGRPSYGRTYPYSMSEQLENLSTLFGAGTPMMNKALVSMFDFSAGTYTQAELQMVAEKLGYDVMRNTILPQLRNHNETVFWVHLMKSRLGNDSEFVKANLPIIITAHRIVCTETHDYVHPYAGPRPGSHVTRAQFTNGTLDLFHLTFGLPVGAARTQCLNALIGKLKSHNFGVPKSADKYWFSLLEKIHAAFSIAKVRISEFPELQYFFLENLAKHVLSSLPAQPSGKTNYKLPRLPRCAASGVCLNCSSVSDFLERSTLTEKSWRKTVAERKHIAKALQTYSHIKFIRAQESQPRGQIGLLVLHKICLSPAEKMRAWNDRRDNLFDQVRSFLPPASDCAAVGPWDQRICDAFVSKNGKGWTAKDTQLVEAWIHGERTRLELEARKKEEERARKEARKREAEVSAPVKKRVRDALESLTGDLTNLAPSPPKKIKIIELSDYED